jgi:predicted metal-dependent hydrolase
MLFWRVRRRRRNLPETEEVKRVRGEAKEYLPGRVRQLAAQNGFEVNQIRIKHNVSNWGSCSSKGNINLNLNLMRLPQNLQDYVILHELCHLRQMNHGPEFHALLESLCPGHRELSKVLKQYQIKL